MGKKRLLRKLDEQAAAETEARKQKDLASGAYTINPTTGKPVGEVNTPVTKVAMEESTNLKPFEGSKRVQVTTVEKPVDSPSEAFAGDRKYLDSVDIQKTRQETADKMETGSFAQKAMKTGNYELTPGQVDASIVATQTDLADDKIKGDFVELKKEDPENAAAYDQAETDMLVNNNSKGREAQIALEDKSRPINEIEKIIAQKANNPDAEDGPELTVEDQRKYAGYMDEEMQMGMDDSARERFNLFQKVVQKAPKAEPAIERLGLTDYYPDMGQPLQVGSYSGSIVGSIPIFTAKGGILPMGVYDARRRALQDEATAKKKEMLQLYDMANINAAPQYKQEIDDYVFSMINNYAAATGGNVDLTDANGRKLVEEVNKARNVGKGTMFIQGKAEQILSDLKDEKRYVSDAEQALAARWLKGGFTPLSIMNDKKKQKEFYDIYNKMKSYDNMVYYTAKNLDKVKQDIVPLVADFNKKLEEIDPEYQNQIVAAKTKGDHDLFMTLSMKYVPEADLFKISEKLWDTQDFYEKKGDPETVAKNKNDYYQYFASFFGKEIEPKVTITGNKNFERYKYANDQKKEEKKRIYETYKINIFNDDSKKSLINAAKTGTVKETIENITGLGKVLTDKNGVLFQEIKVPVKEGEKGQTTLNDLQVIRVGNKSFKPEEAFNYYSKYNKEFNPIKDDDGNVTGYEYAPWDENLPKLSPEEQKFAEYINHNINNKNTNIGFNTRFSKGKVYQKKENGKAMREDDYKDEGTIVGAKPAASYEASVGFYDSKGNFVPIATGVKTYDLTNDAATAGLDNFISGSNTEYGYHVKQTEGTTADVGEESDVVEDNDLY